MKEVHGLPNIKSEPSQALQLGRYTFEDSTGRKGVLEIHSFTTSGQFAFVEIKSGPYQAPTWEKIDNLLAIHLQKL
jgi:hypothetical protein